MFFVKVEYMAILILIILICKHELPAGCFR